MLKAYLFILSFIAVLAVSYGFAVPTLISAKDSIAVLAGILIAAVIAPLLLWVIGKFAYSNLIKKEPKK